MTFTETETFAERGGEFSQIVPPQFRVLIEAIHRQAHVLCLAGVGYLTGDRGMLDVSEGESRRIRLARVVEPGESGLCLLFDEPARGLHEADLPRLAEAFNRLRGEHTVILNEHREQLWSFADHLVEMGPGAGGNGGQVVYAGPPRRPTTQQETPLRTPVPTASRDPWLTIEGAEIHNVHGVDCRIPLGRFTCICGVSGSGKSSFVRGVLAPALAAAGGRLDDFTVRRGRWQSVSGVESVAAIVALDQSMPPPNRRSLVATFSGVFGNIRRTFGASPEAKREGLGPSDFGVNAGRGRCAACLGSGEVVEDGLSSVCPACGGVRLGRAALTVRVNDLNIQELLETPVRHLNRCADYFQIPLRFINAITDLGIGYITFGRRIDSLSGGELQRLRLAIRLASSASASTLFLLDEPAVGLHPHDVQVLGRALDRVLDRGRNSLVVVEHDLRLIRMADWVIEFGPGGGPDGGKIVFQGTVEDLIQAPTPTGRVLSGERPSLARRFASPKETDADNVLAAREQATRSTALIRNLLTGDALMDLPSDGRTAEPVVLVTERFWAGRDSWEAGGLDREIPKLLLDLRRSDGADAEARLLSAWSTDPEAWLSVQPFLTDMAVWGAAVPASLVRSVLSHLAKEELRLITLEGRAVNEVFDVRHVWATGERFHPTGEGEQPRRRVLRDALAVGAGYVELRGRDGILRATAGRRLVDIKRALVAPMAPVPAHFSRHEQRGRCLACNGTRCVLTVAETLVIANPDVPADHPKFLTPEAEAVTRGIRRNQLVPFLRRMAKEGLWDAKTPFKQLAGPERALLLHGFWSRPGAGSFLKEPSADPSEVSSWLRWDGLHTAVLAEAQRSRDADWSRKLRDSMQSVICPVCRGTGLQPHAGLLPMSQQISFADWSSLTDDKRKLGLLKGLQPRSARQSKTYLRLLHCLEPLGGDSGPAEVVRRVVQSFTTMAAADADIGDSV